MRRKERYVRKSSSMTLNEAFFGRQPVSLCFYSFLRENKKTAPYYDDQLVAN
jgi:hypothetical protein